MKVFKASNIHKRRTHGFRARMRTKDGRRVLAARRRKGRHRVSITTPYKG
ncbi:MAG: 50S ribosomal protein L34, partial [bacterium]